MVKKISGFIFIAAALFFFRSNLSAQTKTISKEFPRFEMLLTNATHFQSSSVKKGEPSMLIYFSPTCDHCKQFISSLLQEMQSFKHYQIILVTYVDISEVKQFENDYHLKNYKNIIAGTEGTDFVVRYFYDVVNFPFIALYNKNKSLVAVYRQPPPFDKLKNIN
ncbi:MAG: redoxin domain-containing protein [Bacteroidetes bacterium]|nr:redoxin domain-containing protein [Bacteroidota bacterium]